MQLLNSSKLLQIYAGMHLKKIKKGKCPKTPWQQVNTLQLKQMSTVQELTHGEVKTQRWNWPKPTEIPLEKFQKAPTRHSQRISNMEKSKNKEVRYPSPLKSSIRDYTQ